MSAHIAIIGSGVSGLSCARTLAAAGQHPVVFDKGRAPGGRLATRTSRSGWQFDHGAQFVTARGDDFAGTIAAMRSAGQAAHWNDGAEKPHWVGTPDMRAMVRYLANGLDVRQQVDVKTVTPCDAGWRIEHDDGAGVFDRVVLTLPAPQVAGLLGTDHPLSTALRDVQLAPCLSLMAGLDRDAPRPFVWQTDDDGALSWIAEDSSKPGREATEGTAWVAHASPVWSAQHLELDKEAIAERMLPLFLKRIGATTGQVRYCAAHRWRYARVTEALGQPFLRSACGTLYAGGDWCLGPRVEAAWTSGRAMAADLVAA